MRSRSTRYVFQLGPSKRNEGKKLFELPFRMDQKTGSPSRSGNLWQRLATRWQRDGRTGLETRPTWQGLVMLEKAGNAGKSWQRWKKLATLEKAGNAGKSWQRWKKNG
jgi:hypothetical protein